MIGYSVLILDYSCFQFGSIITINGPGESRMLLCGVRKLEVYSVLANNWVLDIGVWELLLLMKNFFELSSLLTIAHVCHSRNQALTPNFIEWPLHVLSVFYLGFSVWHLCDVSFECNHVSNNAYLCSVSMNKCRSGSCVWRMKIEGFTFLTSS